MKRLHFFTFIVLFTFNYQIIEAGSIKRGFGHDHLLHTYASGVNGVLIGENESDVITNLYGISNNGLKEFIIKAGDLNGDGMDESVIVYSNGNNNNEEGSVLKVYDGNRGNTLLTYYPGGHYDPGYGIYMLEIGDYNGDGMDEMAITRHASIDNDEDGFADGSYTIILDVNGNILWNYSPQDIEGEELDSVDAAYLMKSGDFNGDNKDDLAVFHEYDLGSKLLILDVENETCIFAYVHSPRDYHSYIGYMLDVGDYDGDGIMEIAHVRHAGDEDNDGDGFKDGSYTMVINDDGSVLWHYSPHNLTGAGLDSNDAAYLMRSGDFTGDNKDDLAVFHKYGEGSKLILLNGDNGNYLYGSVHSEHSGYKGYMLETGDFDGDGIQEIAHVRHSTADNDGDGIADGSYTKVINGNGSILWTYSPQDLASSEGLEWDDAAYLMKSGDFNGDGNMDLAAVHYFGTDQSKTIFLNGSDGSIINESYISSPNICKTIEVLKNDITNVELLRAIDFINSPYAGNLSKVKDLFNACDFELAMSKLHKYFTLDATYLNPKKYPAGLGGKEYYKKSGGADDIFINNIKEIATDYYKDTYYDDDDIEITHNSGLSYCGPRVFRLLYSFKSRVDSVDLTQEEFNYGIKSVLSHLRYFALDEHYFPYSNHDLLFGISKVNGALGCFYEFKEFNINSQYNWQNITYDRLNQHINDHILSDGMHDEHAIEYAFWVATSLCGIGKFYKDNDDIFSVYLNTADASAKMYEYLMYAVKPITPHKIPDGSGFYSDPSDIPMIGDSRGILDKYFGKKNPAINSILYYPIQSNYPDYWSPLYDDLAKQLLFTANAGTLHPPDEEIPSNISKYFSEAQLFISRSNWVTGAGLDEYDRDARYCYFKGGKVMLTKNQVKPEYSIGHMHADLLSVDLAAYDKNLIVDPGGYFTTENTNKVQSQDFINLYGHQNNFHDRYYFKGTASHNTVYINQTDQLVYDKSWLWERYSIDDIEPIEMVANSNLEYDFISAGYQKKYEDEQQHIRNMLYIKPEINNKIENDYWVFSDLISFAYTTEEKLTEQIWHLYPAQFDTTTPDKIVKCSNFWIIPIVNTNYSTVEIEELDGFYAPDRDKNVDNQPYLFPTKVIKYKKSHQGYKPFPYLTIVFPFDESVALSSPTNIAKMDIMKRVLIKGRWVLHSVTDDVAQAFHLTFTKAGNTFHDFCAISHTANPMQLYWDKDGDGKVFMDEEHTFDSRMEFIRYEHDSSQRNNIGAELKHLSLNYGAEKQINLAKENVVLPTKYNLYQNYPNPFNPSSIIRFDIPEQSHITLKIYDIQGKIVAELFSGKKDAGRYTVQFDGSHLSSGVYFYELVTNNYREVKKMMLVK